MDVIVAVRIGFERYNSSGRVPLLSPAKPLDNFMVARRDLKRREMIAADFEKYCPFEPYLELRVWAAGASGFGQEGNREE